MRKEYVAMVDPAKGYLEVPKLCCQELLDPKRNRLEDAPNVPDGWKMGYYAENLIWPIIFNIKHGIEVFLKAILLQLGDPNESTHDLKKLFFLVKKMVLSLQWKPVTMESGQVEIDQEEIDRVQTEVLVKLEPLIDYFYNNRIVNEKLGTGDIPDPCNELFRYPNMKGIENSFDHQEFLKRLDEKDIKMLWSKIDQLLRFLCDIGYLASMRDRMILEEKNVATALPSHSQISTLK